MENFNEYFMILLFAWSVIQSALMYRAIPRGAWDKLIDAYMERAAQTEMTLDDNIGHVVKSNVTPILERFGIFKDIEEKNEDNPLVTLPDATPVEPVAYDKFLAPYGKREDFGNRQVHIPVNMSYHYDTKNPVGKEYPHPNVNISPDYGADFNITNIAGAWGFGLLATLHKDVTYHISVDYTASVNSAFALNEWLWWSLQLIGKDGTQEIEAVNAIENGKHSAVWEVVGDGQAVTVVPSIKALWANADDNSNIHWHNLHITPQKKA